MIRKRLYMYAIVVVVFAVVVGGEVAQYSSAERVRGFGASEIKNFRVNTSTMYIETSSLAVGDMDGDGISDIAVVYDNYTNYDYTNYTLAVYELNGSNVRVLGELDDFIIPDYGMTVYPRNAYIYDVDGNGKGELFLHGQYNNTTGIFEIGYINSTLKVIHFFDGTDSAVLKQGNSTYIVVAGSGIYSVANNSFSYISGTSTIHQGLVRTGNFSNDSNIAVMDSDTIYFYSFKNNTLYLEESLNINIPVNGWGNDVDEYMDGFITAKLVKDYYDAIFIVTYHNGYTIVEYENGTFAQVVTSVLDENDDNAMCAAAGEIYDINGTDEIVIGFGNNIDAPLFKVYMYINGNISEIYSQPAEDGNTKIIVTGNVSGDGLDEIIIGSESEGYIRVFTGTITVDELDTGPALVMAFVTTIVFLGYFRRK